MGFLDKSSHVVKSALRSPIPTHRLLNNALYVNNAKREPRTESLVNYLHMCRRALSVVLFILLVTTSTSNGNEFDSERAFQLLEKICEFGPRVPGSEAHSRCLKFFKDELHDLGYTVYLQEFEETPTLLKKKVMMTNLIAYHEPLSTETVILLSSHWDSRPIAEHDPSLRNRTKPIVGANDGASANAVLLELARLFNTHPYAHHLVFVFFDGEDLGTRENLHEYCLGSRYLARTTPPFLTFDFGINLDMIGDKDLLIKVEPHSYTAAADIVREFWKIGQQHYPAHFSSEFSPPILDDHYPFISQGISYINIIDFEFPYWHTQKDTPENCSAFSLKVVGDTVVKFVNFKLKIE